MPSSTRSTGSKRMPFNVRLQPSGQTFQTIAEESILDAALREGIALPYGCRNGTCISCRGRIVEGEVSYPHGWPKALRPDEARDGWSLLCRACPGSDVAVEIHEIRAAADLPLRTLPARVTKKTMVAHDVVVLSLKLPEGERLQHLAGQYVDILLRDGRRRSFSLADAPGSGDTLSLHIRHVPDGEFSGYVVNHLKERSLLRIRGPLGGFFLRETNRALIFVAGGTGFAPIKSLIESALARGDTRSMCLYWGVRARRDLYLHELALAWAREHPNLRYVPVLSEPSAEDRWTGRTGLVHQAVLDDFPDLSAYQVYSSGPPVMIDAAWATFAERGLPPEHHFSDSFEFAYETGADSASVR